MEGMQNGDCHQRTAIKQSKWFIKYNVKGTPKLIRGTVRWNLPIVVSLGIKSGCYTEVACVSRSNCTLQTFLGLSNLVVIEVACQYINHYTQVALYLPLADLVCMG